MNDSFFVKNSYHYNYLMTRKEYLEEELSDSLRSLSELEYSISELEHELSSLEDDLTEIYSRMNRHPSYQYPFE